MSEFHSFLRRVPAGLRHALWCASLVSLLALSLLQPSAALPAPPTPSPPGQATPGTDFSFTWSEGASRFTLKGLGVVDYAPDGTDIRAIEDGGYLLVEERQHGSTSRRLEVKRGANGSAERSWSVNGVSRPFDQEAGRWLAATLQSFHRLEAAQGEQMRALVEQEAQQRRSLRGLDSETGKLPMTPMPDDNDIAPLSPPMEFLRQQREIAAMLEGAGSRALEAFLKQEKEFREPLLRAAAGFTGSEERIQALLREELKRAGNAQKPQ